MVAETTKVRISRAMQVLLVAMLVLGLYYRSGKIMINALMSLCISFLPELLERDYRISMAPGLVLWLTTAVFLHAFGTLGPYTTLWWWDHFTHFVSSSLVAGAGYATVRAIDEHYDDIHLPNRYMFVFILLFVLAFGVIWEVFEFGITLASELLGTKTILTQYGLEDTMKDLVFDTLGGLVVAVAGEAYLTGFVQHLVERLEEKSFVPVN